MSKPDPTKAAIAASALLLLSPPSYLEMILAGLPKPKDRCVQCNKKIPPGRAGRRCPECRGLAS